jgi:anti-anti-sigma factor
MERRSLATTADHVVGLGRVHGFRIGVAFTGDQIVVGVVGEIDAFTAPYLLEAIGELIDVQRDVDLVLDLAELEFIDASGLRVIATASAQLGAVGRLLLLRSPPPMTVRILQTTGLIDRVRVSPTLTSSTRPAIDRLAYNVVVDLHRVAAQFEHTALDAALERLTVLAAAALDSADGVSVTLDRNGRLATVASSNPTVLLMDAHQYETGQGPCLSAATEGQPFYSTSLATEDRWPIFVPRAISEGIASILSSPLLAADQAIGALNIYSNTERAFDNHEQQLATLFAGHASAMLHEADYIDADTRTRIADALSARETIAQAQGVLMARDHNTPDTAAASLHRSARTARITVLSNAANIVAGASRQPMSEV